MVNKHYEPRAIQTEFSSFQPHATGGIINNSILFFRICNRFAKVIRIENRSIHPKSLEVTITFKVTLN